MRASNFPHLPQSCSCNDVSVAGVEECVGEYINPTTQQLEPREWSNTFPNFDNVGSSLFVCFITSTLNGYTATMVQV
jgi:hypothetical protein